ncbi:adenosylmethionine--8-amino-7-oxononanoate transaminase [Olivibacter domesticus]|uniref:Adenosylmethionine-8-amino-7-oxononanoate aminotransferase n=1 Tax=Olivibacter domesticus TaxID=407022 RepID=A0A1H7HR86_OLID1|nr:adenosylmethionine--8-amino-7-oxononanoate transaminase [Olivibacter domesticus]SEK52698.1 adenosylmethionine-8-amino-7-oxononanoate aminotransferase [Olivibacter domesticus]
MSTNLSERDAEVIWHPYTQMKNNMPAIPIVRGEGAYVYGEDGQRYIDAISSWWVNIHGHAHPYIANKVFAQFKKLEHMMFAGFTHSPAVELAERLLDLLPSSQKKVFYSDNGSTAVEVALKMCVQYWYNKGQARKKIIAFKNSYHGDTFGAMAVSGRSVWTAPFEGLMFDVHYIETPNRNNITQLLEEISQIHQEVACFIYEPIVQGSAGMLSYEAALLDKLMSHCSTLNVLLIQDEVFTGFGRTGKLFAANHLQQQPDFMCFSKGLTGGALPLGITSCAQYIYDMFLSDDSYKTLFHGHSFTANPLCCAAALASLDLLLTEETQQNIQRICLQHKGYMERISLHPKIKGIRCIGTILALEWETGEETSYFSKNRDKLYKYFINKGIILRPLGNVIYVLPPYCIRYDDLNYIYDVISSALEKI